MIKRATLIFSALGLAMKAGGIIFKQILAEDGNKTAAAQSPGHRYHHHSRRGKSGVPKARREAKKRQRIAAKMPK